jgi:hypothetical protein
MRSQSLKAAMPCHHFVNGKKKKKKKKKKNAQ